MTNQGNALTGRGQAGSVTHLGELLLTLGLRPEELGGSAMGLALATSKLPLLVPRPFLDRMRPGDPQDPLLLQVLPSVHELEQVPGFTSDPLGEARAAATSGLLCKYRGRALLVVTGACPIHCRFCFRRHFPFADHQDLQPALEQIAADASIEEVILSGGDPLMADDSRLQCLVRQLAGIPHLRRLRLHTRMPVVVPQRVNDDLLAWLTGGRLQPVVVLHANHAQEIDEEVRQATTRLRDAGVPLLNQAVLLRGINDTAGALQQLSEALLSAGVLFYYLHLLDRVQGAAHFEVDEETARTLITRLAAQAPGYLVPRLVREREGAPFKVPLVPDG